MELTIPHSSSVTVPHSRRSADEWATELEALAQGHVSASLNVPTSLVATVPADVTFDVEAAREVIAQLADLQAELDEDPEF